MKRNSTRSLIVLCVVLLATRGVDSRVITVRLDGTGDHEDIQSALDAAQEGDTVIVGPGDYEIAAALNFNRDFDPENPDRGPAKNLIVRSEEGRDVTRIVKRGGSRNGPEYGSAVTFGSGEGRQSILEGFTLTGASGFDGSGGGLLCTNRSSPTVRGCAIVDNQNGVSCRGGADPALVDCLISKNGDGCASGGVSCLQSSITLINCEVLSNGGAEVGAGIFAFASTVTLTRCAIAGNNGHGQGGGVLCNTSSLVMTQCVIRRNCGNTWNDHPLDGGGVVSTGGSMLLSNCEIVGNSPFGVSCPSGSVQLRNCTISASREAGLVAGSESVLSVSNSIVWGNAGPGITAERGAVTTVAYSCIGGAEPWEGPGNIAADPLFEAPLAFDFGDCIPHARPEYNLRRGAYSLGADSPCMDAGTTANAPPVDIRGAQRPCGTGVDMGAYEAGACAKERFVRGDCTGDREVSVADAMCALDSLFDGGAPPSCRAALDVNGDASVNIADPVSLLNFLFAGGPDPVAPFPECGASELPSDAALGCETPRC